MVIVAGCLIYWQCYLFFNGSILAFRLFFAISNSSGTV